MPDQDRFSDHTTEPAGLCHSDHGDDQMKQEDQEVAHSGNRTKTPQPPDFAPILEFAMDRKVSPDKTRPSVRRFQLSLTP
jgi:hypothetical protein